jgi:hypothetical protein
LKRAATSGSAASARSARRAISSRSHGTGRFTRRSIGPPAALFSRPKRACELSRTKVPRPTVPGRPATARLGVRARRRADRDAERARARGAWAGARLRARAPPPRHARAHARWRGRAALGPDRVGDPTCHGDKLRTMLATRGGLPPARRQSRACGRWLLFSFLFFRLPSLCLLCPSVVPLIGRASRKKKEPQRTQRKEKGRRLRSERVKRYSLLDIRPRANDVLQTHDDARARRS